MFKLTIARTFAVLFEMFHPFRKSHLERLICYQTLFAAIRSVEHSKKRLQSLTRSFTTLLFHSYFRILIPKHTTIHSSTHQMPYIRHLDKPTYTFITFLYRLSRYIFLYSYLFLFFSFAFYSKFFHVNFVVSFFYRFLYKIPASYGSFDVWVKKFVNVWWTRVANIQNI